MSLQHIIRWYALLLRLYPRAFQMQFGAEMQTVFRCAAQEAEQAGNGRLWRWMVRELGQFPLSLVEQWWFAFSQGRSTMVTFKESAGRLISEAKPAAWGESLFVGLPHVLFALSVYLPYMLNHWFQLDSQGWVQSVAMGLLRFAPTRWLLLIAAPQSYWDTARILYALSGWLLLLTMLIITIVAWRRGFPRWSAGWVGYALVALFLEALDLRVIYEVQYLEAIVPLVWFVLCLVVYGRLAGRDLFSGLMAALPFFPMLMWWIACDGIRGMLPEIAAFWWAAAVMSAVVVFAYRRGSLGWALAALLVGIPVGGAYLAYLSVYQSNMPNPPDPSMSQVLIGLLGNFLGLAIIGAPIWGVFLYKSLRERNAAG